MFQGRKNCTPMADKCSSGAANLKNRQRMEKKIAGFRKIALSRQYFCVKWMCERCAESDAADGAPNTIYHLKKESGGRNGTAILLLAGRQLS